METTINYAMVRHEKGYDIEIQPNHLACPNCFKLAQLDDGSTAIGEAIILGGSMQYNRVETDGTSHGYWISVKMTSAREVADHLRDLFAPGIKS